MKIIILDKDTTTATGKDISFKGFEEFGETVTYANLTDADKIIEAAEGADVIVVNKVNLTSDIIARLPNTIKLIAITATGYDNVDVAQAAKQGIKVANVPGYGTHAVSQLAMLLILTCATQLITHVDFMRKSGWDKVAGLNIPMHEIAGKTLGVIGLGEIGTAIAKLGLAFGMKVIAYNRTPKNLADIEQVSLNELASRSDFVSLSCALNKETRHLINAEFLASMKPTAYLINTARGGLVDEAALVEALRANKIAGAALDVLDSEPPALDNPLLTLKNVLLTPHIGWAPVEARQRCIDITLENTKSFFAGQAKNLLN